MELNYATTLLTNSPYNIPDEIDLLMLVYLVEKESFITPFRSGEFPSVKPFSVDIAFGDRLDGGEVTLPATVELLVKTAFSLSAPVVGLGHLSVTTWTSSPESVSKMNHQNL